MGDTNLKKNDSVLLYLNMSGLDRLILYLEGVLHLEIQIHYCLWTKNTHNTFMSSLLTSRQKSNCLRFLVNSIIIELLLRCIA